MNLKYMALFAISSMSLFPVNAEEPESVKLREKIQVLEDYEKIFELAEKYEKYSGSPIFQKKVPGLSRDKAIQTINKVLAEYVKKLDEFFEENFDK